MKLYRRYFMYGIVVTSFVWGFSILLYTKMDTISSSSGNIDEEERSQSKRESPIYVDSNQEIFKAQKFNDRDNTRMYKRKHDGGMRYPQMDEELNQRLLEENQVKKMRRLDDRQMNERMSFDDFMFKKQHDYVEKYHNDHQLHADLKPAQLAGEKKPRRRNTGDQLEDLGLIRTPQDQKTRDEGQKLYAFNLLISNRLSYHRDIPDTRDESCKNKIYSRDLPSTSVVICFHNEAQSALLRTIHSVLDRTPAHLLHEIVLVDDYSDIEDLKQELEDYIAAHFTNVHLYRTEERQGLIRARLLGAEKSSGQVLVFLDSHCEVNTNWLPPLISRIHSNQSIVTIPIVDIIDEDTFRYEPSPLVRGGFNWGMHFRWDSIPQEWFRTHSISDPVPTPTMSGGLFAIDREYFYKMGSYDPGLNIWGGENLEISFRIWQCGGRLEIIPCSRVGHVFRKRRPYSSPGGDAMLHNSLRVARVWMDEYIEHFFKTRTEAHKGEYGDISERLALREDLGCKSFDWYLKHVYPEQTLPDSHGRSGFPKGGYPMKDMPKKLAEGHIHHRSTKLCVASEGGVYSKRALLHLVKCQQDDKEQVWAELDNESLRLAGQLCLDVESSGRQGESFPRLMKCHFSGGSQQWKRIGHFQTLLYNPASGKCLGVEGLGVGSYLTIELCNEDRRELQFDLRSFV